MIKAKKSTSFEIVFSVYNKRLLRRHFHRICLMKHWDKPTNPAIFLVNHSSWWDPLVLFYLNTSFLETDAIAMMSEEGLTRFPFFRKIGAFSISQTSRKSIIRSLNYASEQISEGKSVFIFPQGKEIHLEKRPLSFFSGAAYLSEKHPTIPVIPITFYHSLCHYQLPEWYITIGEAIRVPNFRNRKEGTNEFEKRMESQLDELRVLVIEEKKDTFTTILQGKTGVSVKLEKFKQLFKRRG
ncbi:lysophospholipid acyltransferase family protein [Evansella sp. AB-rgal1]|uniref:lysophospholipid acyltransferase family protein n=1 Tax=Evansella sp. AB-rgal1 TaxID=3242696 RepID=UPI00359E0307